LRPVASTVAAVTVAGQRTAASLQVGGGDVVEHQHAVFQTATRQLVLDEALLTAKPVEGGVDLARGDAAEAEGFAQRVAGGGTVELRDRCRRGTREPGTGRPDIAHPEGAIRRALSGESASPPDPHFSAMCSGQPGTARVPRCRNRSWVTVRLRWRRLALRPEHDRRLAPGRLALINMHEPVS